MVPSRVPTLVYMPPPRVIYARIIRAVSLPVHTLRATVLDMYTGWVDGFTLLAERLKKRGLSGPERCLFSLRNNRFPGRKQAPFGQQSRYRKHMRTRNLRMC